MAFPVISGLRRREELSSSVVIKIVVPPHAFSFAAAGAIEVTWQPMFSPDGRWISFTSNRSGGEEVYVKPYAVEGGIVAISTDGGTAPRWARNGRELFYRNGDQMMVVSVETEPTFQAETPRLLFEEAYDYYSLASTFNYDISPAGQRFVMVEASEQPARTQIHVVINWFEELKRPVPTGQ